MSWHGHWNPSFYFALFRHGAAPAVIPYMSFANTADSANCSSILSN